MVSSGLVDRIRAEEGNLRYEYFFPMDDPETVLLIDKWANEHALAIHHKSPMMNEIKKLRDKYQVTLRVDATVMKDPFNEDVKVVIKDGKLFYLIA